MTQFTLVIMPNGKGLMTTEERIPPAQLHDLAAVWREWREGHQDVLFIAGTRVVLVEDIELDLKGDNDMGTEPEVTAEDTDQAEETAEDETEETTEEETAEPEAAE